MLFLILGLIFGALGCFAAFFITYEEYKHHFNDKKKILKHSLETGVFAFVVFLAISILVGFVFSIKF